MKVLQKHRTPLYRQLHEAVLIARSRSVLLNAKSEYNRCLLPTLSVEFGNKNSCDWKQDQFREEEEEDLQEVTKRKENPVCIPRRRKRRKIDTEEGEKSSRESSKTGKRKRKYNEFAAIATMATTDLREKLPSSDKPKASSKLEKSIANQEKPSAKNLISHFEKIHENQKKKYKLDKSIPSPFKARNKKLIFDGKNVLNSANSSKETHPAGQPTITKIKVTPPFPGEARANILLPNKPKNSAKNDRKTKKLSPRIQKITNFFSANETQPA